MAPTTFRPARLLAVLPRLLQPTREDELERLIQSATVEQVELRALAERTAASVELLDRQKDAFLASISHDLRNPLATIAGTAQLLERHLARHDGVPSEELARACATIRRAVARAVVELDEMTEVARLGSGDAPLALQCQPTDLVTLAGDAARDFGRSNDRNPITFDSAEESLVGSWDVARLERTLANLLSNAAKYSPTGGPIAVRVDRERSDGGALGTEAAPVEWAVLSVRDRGIGIPAADLPHVFDRYRRASNAPGHITGSGIGLADVKHVAERHGGRVAVQSVAGSGSVFTVWLPLAPVRFNPLEPRRTGAEAN